MLLALAPAGTRALDIDGERTFGYTSVYLDTPELLGYHQAAHRRRRRFKVRSRCYDGSGLAYLEVKTRDGAHTVKTRLEGRHARGDGLSAQGCAFVADTLTDAGIAADVVPLARPGAAHPVPPHHPPPRRRRQPGHRRPGAHLDRHGDPGDHLAAVARGGRDQVGGVVSPMDRLLWSRGVRPTRISKYATGLAALDPALPHNRWSRTLRRHF